MFRLISLSIILLYFTSFVATAQKITVDWSDKQNYSKAHNSGLRIIGHTDSHYYILTEKAGVTSSLRLRKYSIDHELIEDNTLNKLFDKPGIKYLNTVSTANGQFWIMANNESKSSLVKYYAVKIEGGNIGSLQEIMSVDPANKFEPIFPFTFGYLFDQQLFNPTVVVSPDRTYAAAYAFFIDPFSKQRFVSVSLTDANLKAIWKKEYVLTDDRDQSVKQIAVNNKGEVALLVKGKDKRFNDSPIDEQYHYYFLSANTTVWVRHDLELESGVKPVQAGLQLVEHEEGTRLIIAGFYREDARKAYAQAGAFFKSVAFESNDQIEQILYPYEGTALGRKLQNPYEYSRGYESRDIDTYVFTRVRSIYQPDTGVITLSGEHSYQTEKQDLSTNLPVGGSSSTVTLTQLSFTTKGELLGATTIKRPYSSYWGGSLSYIYEQSGTQTLLLYNRSNRGEEKKALKSRGFKQPGNSTNYSILTQNGETLSQDVLYSYGQHGAFYPQGSFVSDNGTLLLSMDYGFFKVGKLQWSND